MAITRAEFTINDLNDIVAQPTPPTNPAVGMLWQNTSVNPNELLSWTGKGTQTDRRYAASKAGASVLIEDLSDNRALGVLVKTVAKQPTGTPTLLSPLALTGYDKLIMRQPKNRNLMPPLTEVKSSYGVTFTPSAVSGSILVTGTSTNAINFALVGAWNSGVPLYWLKAGTYTLKQSSPDIDIRLVSNTTTLARASAPTFTLVADTPVTSVFAVIAAGKTLNTTINFQIDEGTSSTEYIKYDAIITEATPLSTLWGIPGYEDRWGSGGGEQHYTGYASLHGSESGWYESIGNAGANTRLYAVPLIATTPQASSRTLYPGIVSNRMVDRGEGVWASGAYADTGSVCALHAPANSAFFNLYIRVPTSLAADLAAFKIWLASNPIQVAYRKETPDAGVYGAPVQINGFEGANVITSDGSSVQVEYTGTGWANVGAPERLDIENVSISKEQGLRVDTILSDGTSAVPVYFNARGTQVGLYRTSDNKQLWGGKLLPNGKVVGVSGAIVDPDGDGNAYYTVDTTSNGVLFDLVHATHNGPGPTNYADVDFENMPITAWDPLIGLGGYTVPNWNPGEYSDSIYTFLASIGSMDIYADQLSIFANDRSTGSSKCGISFDAQRDSSVRFWGVVYSSNSIRPTDSGSYNLGSSTLRWKELFATVGSINTSDEREKHDISTMQEEQATKFVMAMVAKWFRHNCMPEALMAGFTAQDTIAAMEAAGMPEDCGIVNRDLENNGASLGMRNDQLVAPLYMVVQSQQRRIDDLESRLAALEAKIG